jgi:hypothetical protein
LLSGNEKEGVHNVQGNGSNEIVKLLREVERNYNQKLVLRSNTGQEIEVQIEKEREENRKS